MQPTYLPWAGYFNLIARVDRFVFLDDVQHERRSWQSRNRILLHGKEHYLTVPTRKAPRSALVGQLVIDDDQPWRQKHLQSLRHAYGRTEAGRDIIELIETVFRRQHHHLVELNVDLITAINAYLGLDVETCRAMTLQCGGKRSAHLAQICGAVACSEYVSPAGARAYLTEDGFEHASAIGLVIQDYVPRPYTQHGTAQFVSHLSIVDVLAHCGREFTRSYILQGVMNA